MTRTVALTIDLVLVNAVVVVGVGILGLLDSLVGDLGSGRLVAAVVGAAWALTVSTYFVVFWSLTGQTPGLRAMRLRVVAPDERPPSVGRAVVRLGGLVLAIVPLCAGLLPILFDRRRRGLHDLLAGTVVRATDH